MLGSGHMGISVKLAQEWAVHTLKFMAELCLSGNWFLLHRVHYDDLITELPTEKSKEALRSQCAKYRMGNAESWEGPGGKMWTKSGAREGLWERNVKFDIWGWERLRSAESNRSFQIVKKVAKALNASSKIPAGAEARRHGLGQGRSRKEDAPSVPSQLRLSTNSLSEDPLSPGKSVFLEAALWQSTYCMCAYCETSYPHVPSLDRKTHALGLCML